MLRHTAHFVRFAHQHMLKTWLTKAIDAPDDPFKTTASAPRYRDHLKKEISLP
jgi:hypothetical protein